MIYVGAKKSHYTTLRAQRSRVWSSSVGKAKKSLFTSLKPLLGPTQSPIQWAPEALSTGIKRPGREAVHLPSVSAEVKSSWIFTFTPPYAFLA
jgi:hypothetical protein